MARGKGLDPKRDELPDLDDDQRRVVERFLAGELDRSRLRRPQAPPPPTP